MKNILFITFILISSAFLSACSMLKQLPTNQQIRYKDTTQVEQSDRDGTTTQAQDQSPTSLSPNYIEHTPSAVADAASQGKKVVLFFYAPWCPFCKAAQEDIVKRITEIPENIVIIRTDYDSSTDLKKKYGITYQHTFVQVDGEGNQITIWNGGDLDEIIKNVR
jgi:thiol-disulfide isomerase/thioredoxin